ncbi:MAG: glutamine--fructose-6-phosphate aminotransferase, partial [Candidatus Margulisbacteria bacterium]|nr:glutamine--fructose-6-phosphate aminotransferase [Candidatus Margulisiibacteriota bacterium]
MCGIFGYIGNKEATPFLIEGLRKLEYRGYDSAGIATLDNKKLFVSKCVGKIDGLEEQLKQKPVGGEIGIGHTRWATHGKPCDENSHPHEDCTGKIVVVHNGIVENYLELRRQLANKGHKFTSTTDTEILAHLIEDNMDGNLLNSVLKALMFVKGSYALAVISEHEPDKIIIARQGSPLIVGFGENETYISSDIPALLKHTAKIIKLDNGELAEVGKNSVKVINFKKEFIDK